MASLKELAQRQELFTGGHRLCGGCGAGIMARQVMLAAAKYPIVVVNATGCLEVSSTIFPFSAWRVPWIHSAFENAGATASGIEAAYRALKKQGRVKKDARIIVISGDGGTYDIGLQSLSGALERGHRITYICYNNDAYMNTGVQRSSATPLGAHTATSPAGKNQNRKDLTAIVAAHHPAYLAQTAVGWWHDLTTKMEKALAADGPSFLNIYTPCPRGWGFDPQDTVEIGKLAVETCFWPLYEISAGQYHLNYIPRQKRPLRQWLEKQTRFRHLTADPQRQHLIEQMQNQVDADWKKMLSLTR